MRFLTKLYLPKSYTWWFHQIMKSYCWHFLFIFYCEGSADDSQWVSALLPARMTLLVVDFVKDWQSPKAIDPDSMSWLIVMLYTDMHPFGPTLMQGTFTQKHLYEPNGI